MALSPDASVLVQQSVLQHRDIPLPPVVPKDDDVFIGHLECSIADVGLRIQMHKFPESATVEVFPYPMQEMASRRWCRPVTNCSASFEAVGTFEYDVLSFASAPGKSISQMKRQCDWNEFTLTGSIAGTGEQTSFNGGVVGEPALTPISHLGQAQLIRVPKPCRDREQAIMSGWKGGGHGFVHCHKFRLERCTTLRPKADEKVLYMLQAHSSPNAPAETDDFLGPQSKKMALSINHHPLFKTALGDDPTRRAEVVYVAPTARALQSAILAFGEYKFLEFRLEPMLVEHNHALFREKGDELIREMADTGYLWPENAGKIMMQYNDITGRVAKDKKFQAQTSQQRVDSFKAKLLAQPEKRFIVVGHRTLFDDAWLILDGPGAVDSRVLRPGGHFSRESYDPRCWGTI